MTTVTLSPPSSATTSVFRALHLLEAYQEHGKLDRADTLARSLLARFPDTAAVLVCVARLRARQGRYDEAMELLMSEHVGKNVRLLNYRHCAPLRPVGGERVSA